VSSIPVIKLLASEARNTTAFPISSAVPTRPIGISFALIIQFVKIHIPENATVKNGKRFGIDHGIKVQNRILASNRLEVSAYVSNQQLMEKSIKRTF
jgi:hypothetical protein